MNEKVKKALDEAVSAIYFADNSDYISSLWIIVSLLGGEEAVDLLERDEGAAFAKYCTVRCAAVQSDTTKESE